ncbi:MAG: hypothetical protein JXA69_19040 [Phycisphaerae bacterium]|nr:hypothetical protein [Phycisphaerae bacterium]
MANSLFDELRACLQWTEADSARLRAVRPRLAPRFAAVADAVYRRLAARPGAAAVLAGGPEQAARIRATLERWLVELFQGPHDEAFFRRHRDVGGAHTQAGLPCYYVLAAMGLMRHELAGLILRVRDADHAATLDALHRVMDLEMALFLESYGEAMTSQIHDTERREMGDRLREAEQLASVGRLAASLAHEIRNPLAGISGAIQVIGQAMAPEDPHREVIEEILKQIRRLDAAVQDLLVYSRPKPPQYDRCRLGAAVLRVVSLLRQEPDVRRVKLTFDGLDAGPEVWLDEAQLQQVVANILLNAAQACTEGQAVEIRIVHDDETASVIIRDTGRGMSPTLAEQAFEPFFTTKAKGTGLGLPICRKIVEAHGGVIHLDSQPGKGTTVTVTFPLRPPAADGCDRAARSEVDE